jgi:hypothetical protein
MIYIRLNGCCGADGRCREKDPVNEKDLIVNISTSKKKSSGVLKRQIFSAVFPRHYYDMSHYLNYSVHAFGVISKFSSISGSQGHTLY